MKNKKTLYEQITVVAKAVASPNRLELLDYLSQSEKTVEVLSMQTNISVKLTSAHLKSLKAAQLVESRRDGRFIYYRIADNEVVKFLVSLRALAEKRLTSIQETLQAYAHSTASMSQLDRRSLIEKAESGDVIVIDVRPHDEFVSGHLPHARSVPLSELKKMMSKLPKNKEIVAYCRGAYCVLSQDAVSALQKKGYRASRLSEGISEWIAAGLRLARGAESN